MPLRDTKMRSGPNRGVHARGRLAALIAALLLTACGDADYPSDWAPLRAPAKARGVARDSTEAAPTCPDLTGEFRLNNRIVYGNLIERLLNTEQREIDWYSATIRTTPGDSLEIEVARNALRDTVRVPLRKVFRCADGWLTGSWPDYLIRPKPEDRFDDDRGYQRQLFIARDEAGRLIGREVLVSHVQFAVWCGDGCKYLGVPGTRREEVRWHRMSTLATADRDNGEPLLDSATNARIAREDAALEAGLPPLPPPPAPR